MTYEDEIPVPGEFIQEELEARGWSQRDLAFILGTEETALNKIIKGKTGVSLEMSKALASAFNVDADFFANLQKVYDLARVAEADPAIARRASLQSEYPVREMIKRGWLAETSDMDLLEALLASFLKADNNNVRQIHYAARKTNSGDEATKTQLAWLYRVVQLAENMPGKLYSERALYEAKSKLKALMRNADNIQRVPAILAECGVKFIIVEGLPNAKIDGVCIWLDPKTPVIAMSLRYDRIDNFWFVLWHEIAHVLNRDGRDESAWIIDVELEKDRARNIATNSAQERKANQFATEQCLSEHELVSFCAPRAFFAERDVVAFAHRKKIHPGILVGQIQNRTDRWDLLRKHLVKIRQYIIPAAMTDGWGQWPK